MARNLDLDNVQAATGTITTLVTTTFTATTFNATTVTATDLVLNSTNEINIQIGGVGLLAIDDAAISVNPAANDTAGLDAYLKTQDGGSDTSADGGNDAGDFNLGTGGGGVGGGGQNGGASGAYSITIGNGGAPIAGSANGGNASGYNVVGGTGGTAGASGGTGGQGTTVTFTVGPAGAAGGGSAGVDGVIRLSGTVALKQGAPATVTTAATLTVAQMLSGIITGSDTDGSTVNLTLPTGTAMDAALPSEFVANDSFDIVIINLSPDEIADTYTLVANTGSGDFTIVGPAIIASSHVDAETNAATFRCRKTASNTFVAYRVG